jgi:hypothetical protein
MKRFLSILIVVAGLTAFGGPVSASGNLSPWVESTIEMANRDRRERGIPELSVSQTLSRAAALKLADMEQEKYFAHTSPLGRTPWSFMDDAGYGYRYAGENLAIHFSDPESEHVAWMESEKHCQNILDPRFVEIGLAVRKTYFEGRETVLAVEMFGTLPGEESSSILTKEDAVAMCRGGVPAVSGVSSDGRGIIGSARSALLDEKAYEITDGRYGLIELLAVVLFSVSQIGTVILSLHLIMSRESREGIYPS